MVHLGDSLPEIVFPDGESQPLNREHLRKVIGEAAQKTGYSHWWLAGDVVEGVTKFLALRFTDEQIRQDRLENMILTALVGVGHVDIAKTILRENGSRPTVKISLQELSEQAGNGYEIAFFPLLERALNEVMMSGATLAHVHGLRTCVKNLLAAKRWSGKCNVLNEEIVNRIRTRLAEGGRDIQVSVTSN